MHSVESRLVCATGIRANRAFVTPVRLCKTGFLRRNRSVKNPISPLPSLFGAGGKIKTGRTYGLDNSHVYGRCLTWVPRATAPLSPVGILLDLVWSRPPIRSKAWTLRDCALYPRRGGRIRVAVLYRFRRPVLGSALVSLPWTLWSSEGTYEHLFCNLFACSSEDVINCPFCFTSQEALNLLTLSSPAWDNSRPAFVSASSYI